MKSINNKKGMTLVEIVVSLAIFGIMMVAFLNMFLTSYEITIRAGARSDTVAQISSEMENSLSSFGGTGTDISIANEEISIDYDDGQETIDTIKITGEATNDKNQSVELVYYLPE